MRWSWLLAVVGACGFSPRAPALGDAGGDDDDDAAVDAPPDVAVDGPLDEGGTPPQIVQSGLIEHLDADLGVTGADADVTGWTNQASGGDNVATDAGTIQVVAGNNGHAALRFPNNARMIGTQTVFCGLTSGSGLTWFAVVKPGAQDNAERNQIIGTIKNSNPFSGFTGGANTATANPYTMMRPNQTETRVQSPASALDHWVILAGRLEAGQGIRNAEVFFDSSTAESTGAVTVPATSDCGPLVVGAERTGGSEFFNGEISRILIYNRALSSSELSETGRALSAIYAITTQF